MQALDEEHVQFFPKVFSKKGVVKMVKKNIVSIVTILIVLLFATSCSGLTVGLNGINPAASSTVDEKGMAVIETDLSQTATEMPSSGLEVSDAVIKIQEALEKVYEEVNPSVVNITVYSKQSQTDSPLDLFPELPDIPGFKFEFPKNQQPDNFSQTSLGSGFIWDKEGHIVTNNHVVDGATRILVKFSDSTTVEGKVVGTDKDSDLAVVKIERGDKELKPLQLTDSSQVKVGQIAIAIGNPFGLEGTMTFGIVSAVGRSLPVSSEDIIGPNYTIPDVIQTDAPINPGNSGGVLVDINGRVIGVTTAIESPVRANAGIGYVIPSTIVKRVVPSLIKSGSFEHSWIGISGTSLTYDLNKAMNLKTDQKGALVLEVTPNSPAEKAGLRGSDRQVEIEGRKVLVGGDIIIGIDDQPVNSFDDVVAYLARYTQVGQTIRLKVLRQGKEEVIPLTLAARPKQGKQSSGVEPQGKTAGAWLGIEGMNLTAPIAKAMELPEDQEGVLVIQVEQGSPADKAGLQGSFKPLTLNGERILIGGDVITALNNQSIKSVEDLKKALAQYKAGDEVTLTVLRRSGEIKLKVKLENQP